jgi:hypothetical protein
MEKDKTVLDAMVEGAIARDFANVSQSWELTGLYATTAGTRLRVRIRRNAYDEQSYGRVEVWSPTDLRWNAVHHLAHPQLAVCGKQPAPDRRAPAVPIVSYVQERLSHAGVEAFAADEWTLLAAAMRILGECTRSSPE